MFLFRTRAFELIPAASHTILDRTQDGSAEKNSRWGKKKKKNFWRTVLNLELFEC